MTSTLSSEQALLRDELIRRIRTREGGNVGCGRLLNQIVDQNLHRDTCPTIESFVSQTLGIAPSTASRWQRAAREVDKLITLLHPVGTSAEHDRIRNMLERVQSDSALNSIRDSDFSRQIAVCLEAAKLSGCKKLQPQHVKAAMQRLGVGTPDGNEPVSITKSDLQYAREELTGAVRVLSICQTLMQRDARRLARRLAGALSGLGSPPLLNAHGHLRERTRSTSAPLDETPQGLVITTEDVRHV